jgi:hypothetical protein
MSDSPLDRFLGGKPGAVLVKLVIVSVIVGALLHWTGLSPLSLVRGLDALVQELVGTGWDAVRNIATYAVYGAMVVVPVWLISRLIAHRGK